MKTEMLMPQMGESIAEATILKWLKKVGDAVDKDETILEISTDKVDSEIPAPASGVIVEIRANEGQTVPVKSIIAVIDTDKNAQAGANGGSHPAAKAPEPAPAKSAAQPASGSAPAGAASAAPSGGAPLRKVALETEKGAERAVALAQPPRQQVETDRGAERTVYQAGPQQPAGATSSTAPAAHSGGRFYSPLVRSIAGQHGVSQEELDRITGSGAQGRVTKADILEYLSSRSVPASPGASAAPAAPRAEARPAAAPVEARREPEAGYNEEGVRVEPFDRMRKLIAEHMVRSKHTSPHVYSMAEVDVSTIAKWREKVQPQFQAREGFKLSFTPFFLEAVIKALIEFPTVNASVDGDNLVLKRFVNLGCAVALGTTGLIVPVIKNADQLSFTGISRSLNDLASRARAKKLQPDDIQGGTFTVTNPGIFGNIMGCPIINQPQLAILAIGAIKKRVVVVNDAIAIRDMVYLTLSYDHRVIDGALSGQFLSFIQRYLESWDIDRPLY